MKQGQSLTQIAAELERQIDTRKDYIAKSSALAMTTYADPHTEKLVDVAISGLNGAPMKLTDNAHGQVAARLEIPRKYYDKMRAEEPDLLAKNVNMWLAKSEDRRMVRTLDGQIRAVLSDRYRPLDNYDLAKTALPALQEGKAQVVSAQVTDLRFYIKAIFPDLCQEIPEGIVLGEGHNFTRKDMVIASITISNSEVGAGSLRVEAGCYKTTCSNLAIFDGSAMRKYHIGRSSVAELDNAVEHFTDETRKADDRAFWLKVRDIVAASCNREAFMAQVEKMRRAAGEAIESKDIPAVIEVTRKVLGLGEGLQSSLLTHFIQGQDLSRWGLLNAVTRASADVSSYDEATDLERAGGKILELSPSDWRIISTAKA